MSLKNYPSFLLNLSEIEMYGVDKHFYQFKSFRLDVGERRLIHDGETLSLTPKVFDLLVVLVERAGHLVEREEILQIIWTDSFVEEANITRAIHTLRKVLGENENGNKFIETVPKRGYRFVAVCDEGNQTVNFFDTPTENPFVNPPTVENLQIEKKFTEENNLKKHLSMQVNSANRFRFRVIFAFVLVCGIVISGFFLFKFSRAKSNDILTFEQMKQIRLTQSGDVYSPTISPDGQYLAYVEIAEGKRGLRLRQIATGQILELLSPRPDIDFWTLKFSPDSNYLYYVENKENDLGVLYRISSFGGQSQKLVDFVNGGVTIAPDGKRIAFKRVDKQAGVTSIISVNNDGSDEKTIASIDTDSDYHSLDWSPDGDTILYSVSLHEQNNNIWYVAEVSANGGAEHRIGEPRRSPIFTANWLADKKGLILNAIDAKTKLSQIYYLSYSDGTERRITNDLNDYYGVSITKDGKLFVSQKTEQNREIWILPDGDAAQAKQVTFKEDQHFEAVSWLTDDTLVFDIDENGSYQNHNIWRLKIGESEPQPITTGEEDNFSPIVSPDGSLIAFVSKRTGKRQIWRMNADGTQQTQLTDSDYGVYNPQFSPDGQMIYFSCSIGGEGRLMRISINGGEAVSMSDKDIHSWSISPDGKKLVYVSFDHATQTHITRIRPLDEDRTEKVLDIKPEDYLRWSKDGQAIYFTLAADNTKNIWRQSLSEMTPKQITDFDKEKIFYFASSPDGKNLACIRFTATFDAILLKFGE